MIRGVGVDLVDDDLEPKTVGTAQKFVEIGKSAEDRVDVAIIGDVVPEVRHRRGEEGGQPNPVDTQGRDVIEPLGDAAQVADPVAVGVGEAAWIDLVDDRASPPRIGRLLKRHDRPGIHESGAVQRAVLLQTM
jgi:hypothetical protein